MTSPRESTYSGVTFRGEVTAFARGFVAGSMTFARDLPAGIRELRA